MKDCAPPFNTENEGEEPKNPYEFNKRVFKSLFALGKLTTHLVRVAIKEERTRFDLLHQGAVDFPASFMETDKFSQPLLAQWTEFYVAHMASMCEIHNGRQPTTMGAHVFYEISRLHWLLNRPHAAVEWENTHLIEADQLVPRNYDVLFALAHTESDAWIDVMNSVQEEQAKPTDEAEHAVAARDLKARLASMWNKPVASYTLSETRVLAAFMTQYLNNVRETQFAEYGRVFKILWLRCTELSIAFYKKEDWPLTLDEEDFRAVNPEGLGVANRRYAVFCSFYLGEITRRFFHHEELSPNRFGAAEIPSQELLGRMRTRMHNWIHHIVQSFAEEAFEEMYMSIVTTDNEGGGYTFPGDDGWFRFAWPQRVPSRGAIVTTLRPHMYRRFFSEVQIDRRLVVNQAEKSHLARLFVLKAVDEYIKLTHPRVEWINGVVIDNGGIEMSAYALKGGLAPLLVQVFSGYWLYHRGQVYPTDDLFTTLALWWWFLREHYGSRLYNVDLSAIMVETLEPLPAALLAEQQQQQQSMEMSFEI